MQSNNSCTMNPLQQQLLELLAHTGCIVNKRGELEELQLTYLEHTLGKMSFFVKKMTLLQEIQSLMHKNKLASLSLNHSYEGDDEGGIYLSVYEGKVEFEAGSEEVDISDDIYDLGFNRFKTDDAVQIIEELDLMPGKNFMEHGMKIFTPEEKYMYQYLSSSAQRQMLNSELPHSKTTSVEVNKL